MSVPTSGEEFAKLIEYIRKAQETSATLSHLSGMQQDKGQCEQWLHISELFRQLIPKITHIATRSSH